MTERREPRRSGQRRSPGGPGGWPPRGAPSSPSRSSWAWWRSLSWRPLTAPLRRAAGPGRWCGPWVANRPRGRRVTP